MLNAMPVNFVFAKSSKKLYFSTAVSHMPSHSRTSRLPPPFTLTASSASSFFRFFRFFRFVLLPLHRSGSALAPSRPHISGLPFDRPSRLSGSPALRLSGSPAHHPPIPRCEQPSPCAPSPPPFPCVQSPLPLFSNPKRERGGIGFPSRRTGRGDGNSVSSRPPNSRSRAPPRACAIKRGNQVK